MKPLRFVRNVWILRRDLAAMLFRRLRRGEETKPIRIVCRRCGNELTKPCAPGSPSHVFVWPQEAGEVTLNGKPVRPGMLVYARRQKPRQGQLRPDYELRLKPF